MGLHKIILILAVLISSEAFSVPALVQHNENPITNGMSQTVTATFPGNITAGNLIVVWISWGSITTKPVSVTDAEGNSYTEIPNSHCQDLGNNQYTVMYYKENIACTGGCGTNQVTVSWGGTSVDWRGVSVAEFSGVSTSGSLDKSACNITDFWTPIKTSGSVTTTANGELVVGFVQDTSTGSVTVTLESTSLYNTGVSGGTAAQYEIQSSAGAIASEFTFSADRSSIASIATFKSDAPPPTPIRHRVINY